MTELISPNSEEFGALFHTSPIRCSGWRLSRSTEVNEIWIF